MKVENLLPEVYYKESRDFAYIGRLIELALNSMKTGADSVNVNINDETVDPNIVELLVNSLGFESKHEYITKDLIYIASAFSNLIKYKGTVYAIEMAVRLLLNSQGIKKPANFNFVENENSKLEIRLPEELTDIILLEDLFDYILPAGTIYKFTRVSSSDGKVYTEIPGPENIISHESKSDTELATLALVSKNTNTRDDVEVTQAEEETEKPEGEFAKDIGTIYTGVVPDDKLENDSTDSDTSENTTQN